MPRILQTIRDQRAVRGGTRSVLEIRAEGSDERIPAVLQLPPVPARVPAALLLHGYSSRKEHMSEMVGVALLRLGIASLAIDLPLHGERARPLQAQAMFEPLALAHSWRLALSESTLALRYLGARTEIDRRRIAVVGYSLGAFVAVTVAADERGVGAVVLAAGGDLPEGTPLAGLVRLVADPRAAVRRLGGRPLLMINGRRDRTIRPEQAQRLFEAAVEPKELVWWDAGHRLPPEAIAQAAEWLAARLAGVERQAAP